MECELSTSMFSQKSDSPVPFSKIYHEKLVPPYLFSHKESHRRQISGEWNKNEHEHFGVIKAATDSNSHS